MPLWFATHFLGQQHVEILSVTTFTPYDLASANIDSFDPQARHLMDRQERRAEHS